MIVIDASALLEVLLQTSAAPPIADRLFDPAETLHAPFLLDVEVLQVLRRYARARQVDDARGREALTDLGDLAIERYPHEPLLERVWELRENLTAYDGVYLALAEALGAVLVTCDARLARVAEDAHRLDIEIAVFPSSGKS